MLEYRTIRERAFSTRSEPGPQGLGRGRMSIHVKFDRPNSARMFRISQRNSVFLCCHSGERSSVISGLELCIGIRVSCSLFCITYYQSERSLSASDPSHPSHPAMRRGKLPGGTRSGPDNKSAAQWADFNSYNRSRVVEFGILAGQEFVFDVLCLKLLQLMMIFILRLARIEVC